MGDAMKIDMARFQESMRRRMKDVQKILNEKEIAKCGCVVYKHSGRLVSMCWEHAHQRFCARA